jgi:hypothetical protein
MFKKNCSFSSSSSFFDHFVFSSSLPRDRCNVFLKRTRVTMNKSKNREKKERKTRCWRVSQ